MVNEDELCDLQKLALYSFGKYIAGLCISITRPVVRSDTECREMQRICLRLRELIHGAVPPGLASNVTSFLLFVLNQTEFKILPSETLELQLTVVESLIHPAVSHLVLYPLGPEVLHHVFSQLLPKLNKLQRLEIQRVTYDGHVGEGAFRHLKELRYPELCNDRFLADLSDTCWDTLTALDVSGSRSISRRSLDLLLEFRSLTHLDISYTDLNSRDFISLGLGLPSTITSLRCSHVKVSDFNILAHREVQSLLWVIIESVTTDCPLEVGPRYLKLSSGWMSPNLLSKVGNRIMQLELYYMTNLDVREIARHCSSLQLLTLWSCKHVDSWTGYSSAPNLAAVPRVVMCSRYPDSDLLVLAQCTGVQELQVVCDFNIESPEQRELILELEDINRIQDLAFHVDITQQLNKELQRSNHELIMKLLAVNPLQELKQILVLAEKWRPLLSITMARKLLLQCPKLVTLAKFPRSAYISLLQKKYPHIMFFK